MTYAEAAHQVEVLEAAADAALADYRAAERNLRRPKSPKNRIAFAEASEAHEIVCDACRAARDVAEVLYGRETRAARVEARNVETQLSLF